MMTVTTEILEKFEIPDVPKNRDRVEALLDRYGRSETEMILARIHSRRAVVGGPPRNERQVRRMG